MLNQNLFVHHVYFWLTNPDSQTERQQLLEGIQSLTKVPSIKATHIGVPATTNRDVIEVSYAFSWLALFETKEKQDAYQVDPIHLKFVDDCKHLWSKVVVYDSVGAF